MPSQMLREYYQTNPPGEQRIITLQIIHTVGERCLVQGQLPVTLTLETGEVKEFEPSGFGIKPPSRGVNGREDINITISNTDLEAWSYLKRVVEETRDNPQELNFIQRTYLASNPFEPCDAPCRFVATSSRVTCEAVSVQGVFENLINKLAFTHRYSPFNYPCLQFVN